MQMKLNDEGKRTIEQLHILSGENFTLSKAFLTHLVSVLVLDYMNGNSTTIPYFGRVTIVNDGDEVTPLGKEAIVRLEFEPDPYLKKTIGQIADGVEIETEVEKLLAGRIQPKLNEIIEKD
jgi:hypothetical protein